MTNTIKLLLNESKAKMEEQLEIVDSLRNEKIDYLDDMEYIERRTWLKDVYRNLVNALYLYDKISTEELKEYRV